jgi:peptidase E
MNFDITINKLIAAEKVYIGVSAGSVIAAPKDIYAENTDTFPKALNLVNCYMHVHCEEGNIQPRDKYSFDIWLTDKQAILAGDNTLQIIQ